MQQPDGVPSYLIATHLTQLITVALHLAGKGTLRSAKLLCDGTVGFLLTEHLEDEVGFRVEFTQTLNQLLQQELVRYDICHERSRVRDAVQRRAGVAILVLIFIVEGQHISGATELAVKAVTVTEPELALRADALTVILSLLAEGVVVAGLLTIELFRNLHPLFGGLEVDTVGFTLVCIE